MECLCSDYNRNTNGCPLHASTKDRASAMKRESLTHIGFDPGNEDKTVVYQRHYPFLNPEDIKPGAVIFTPGPVPTVDYSPEDSKVAMLKAETLRAAAPLLAAGAAVLGRRVAENREANLMARNLMDNAVWDTGAWSPPAVLTREGLDILRKSVSMNTTLREAYEEVRKENAALEEVEVATVETRNREMHARDGIAGGGFDWDKYDKKLKAQRVITTKQAKTERDLAKAFDATTHHVSARPDLYQFRGPDDL
jgi:hypothetical protein